MEKEKEIEATEMAKEMCLCCTQNECTPDFGGVVYNPARRAVEAGYGNVQQAVKEFAEKLIELYDDDEDEGVDYSTPCAVIIQNIKDVRDEFLKERFGKGES